MGVNLIPPNEVMTIEASDSVRYLVSARTWSDAQAETLRRIEELEAARARIAELEDRDEPEPEPTFEDLPHCWAVIAEGANGQHMIHSVHAEEIEAGRAINLDTDHNLNYIRLPYGWTLTQWVNAAHEAARKVRDVADALADDPIFEELKREASE